MTVHSAPDGRRYRSTGTVPWGARLPLPAPIGFDLDTALLKARLR
ncbi:MULTISPECIES: hypothetical protein [unclassified Streptomyces]|nr:MULTISPECIES: hypothetical protein [unclassified Streptomyces]